MADVTSIQQGKPVQSGQQGQQQDLGKKLDDWINSSFSAQQQIWSEADPKKSVEEMRKEAEEKISKLPAFKFLDPNDAKNMEKYKSAVLQLAQDSIRLSENEVDGDCGKKPDGKLDYTEFSRKEFKDAHKLGVPFDKKTTQLAFDTIDQNHDGQIDDKEEACLFRAMDKSDDPEQKGKADGSISQDAFATVSGALGEPKYTDMIKSKFGEIYNLLFGKKEETPNQ